MTPTPILKNRYHPLVAILLFFFFLWHFGFSYIEKLKSPHL